MKLSSPHIGVFFSPDLDRMNIHVLWVSTADDLREPVFCRWSRTSPTSPSALQPSWREVHPHNELEKDSDHPRLHVDDVV